AFQVVDELLAAALNDVRTYRFLAIVLEWREQAGVVDEPGLSVIDGEKGSLAIARRPQRCANIKYSQQRECDRAEHEHNRNGRCNRRPPVHRFTETHSRTSQH